MMKPRHLLKIEKPIYSLKLANFDKFIEEQYEKDQKLIAKPKELMFIGKSNVGKSSLLNRLLGTDACRVSKRAVL